MPCQGWFGSWWPNGLVRVRESFLEGSTKGRNGLFQAKSSTLAGASALSALPTVVLGLGPIKWRAFAGSFF